MLSKLRMKWGYVIGTNLLGMLLIVSCAHKPSLDASDESFNDEAVLAESGPIEEEKVQEATNEVEKEMTEATSELEKESTEAVAESGDSEESSATLAEGDTSNNVEASVDSNAAQEAEAVTENIPTEPTKPTVTFAEGEKTEASTSETVSTEASTTPEVPVVVPKVALSAPALKENKLPVPQQNVVMRTGKVMNRFYFVREGDTADSIAKLLYGESAKAKDLIDWNGPSSTWRTGKMLFYVSPTSTESTLRSFYEERAVKAETYTLKKGDQLSELARDKYGAKESLKEIATVNALQEPYKVTPGLNIRLYPSDLSTYAYSSNTQVAQPKVEATEIEDPDMEDIPEVAVSEPDKNISTEAERAKDEKFAAIEVNPFDISWLALISGVSAVITVIGFMVFGRNKKGDLPQDFNE